MTLIDVATHVGMSRSAVSMALSDHPEIAAGTKERVRTAAQQLGYVTNSAARALRSQSSGSIALIVPDTGPHTFGHPYFMHLLVGVTDVCGEHNANVIISANKDEGNSVAAYDRVLRSRAADGAIVTVATVEDPHLSALVESGLPVVLMGRFPQLPEAVSVGIDDRDGARQVTEHLIVAHQRRRLVHLGGPPGHQVTIEREEGFRQALKAAGLKSAGESTGDFTEESGRALTRQLIASGKRFDAIFAANDEMAYGAMTELRDGGLDVPGEVSIVGFDDFGLARVTTPGITTVHIPAEELARAATVRLFQLIGGVRPAEPHLMLPLEVVLRGSCGCL